MVDRINLLLQAKNITSRQFAEEIGIQPSGMSHILSGRNNPSLDFVMKVIRRWPEININWLMFGKGEMFTSVVVNVPSPAPVQPHPAPEAAKPQAFAAAPDLFSSFEPEPVPQPSAASRPVPASLSAPEPLPAPEPAPSSAQASVPLSVSAPAPASVPASMPAVAAAPAQSVSEVNVQTSQPVPAASPAVESVFVAEPAAEYAASPQLNENRADEIVPPPAPVQPNFAKTKRIVKIVVLYDDHTFSEYRPE